VEVCFVCFVCIVLFCLFCLFLFCFDWYCIVVCFHSVAVAVRCWYCCCLLGCVFVCLFVCLFVFCSSC